MSTIAKHTLRITVLLTLVTASGLAGLTFAHVGNPNQCEQIEQSEVYQPAITWGVDAHRHRIDAISSLA